MYLVLQKVISYSVFFGLILIINSCAHFKIKSLEKIDFDSSSFVKLLSKEYLALAKFELYEMHDEIDASLFAYKSSLSINKNTFYPENPKNWKIPLNYQSEALISYEKINKLVKEKAYLQYPENFSKMLAAYDCWIEQVEENWQIEHINQCYNKFDKNFEAIVANMELSKEESNTNDPNNTDKKNIHSREITEEISNHNIKENSLESKINAKIKVFFEFDKFTLSSEQIVELEYFVKSALQNSSKQIIIEGHTDTMGSKKYNLSLSKKRTDFIKKYLIERNLKNIIYTEAFGENKPLVSTDDEVKEKKNRRAELYFK